MAFVKKKPPAKLLKAVAKVATPMNATPVTVAPTPTIVAAVGSAASGKDKDLAKRIEAAMAQAVQDAVSLGIWDPTILRRRQMEARERVKAAG
jgi:hypothetical protein